MNKLLFLACLVFIACSDASHRHAANEKDQHHDSIASLHLNNGLKWKTDAATRRNVTAIKQVIRDDEFKQESNRNQLADRLQLMIDTLVQQCRMAGKDHDALHLWLEHVLKDLKELRKGNVDFENARAALRRDIESFDSYFE